MSIYIKVNNTEYHAAVNGNPNDRTWDGRDTKTITLTMTNAEVAALLPDNTPWSIVQRKMVDKLDEQGKPTGETKEVVNEYDNSEYSLAGEITDHRDGTVSIKMGKPTETESARATVTALAGEPVTYARAVELRHIIEQAAVSLSDGEAASVPELITAWAYPVAYAEGDRRSYGGKVYKCLQGHTSQADWTPDAAPSLFSRVLIPDGETIPEWVQPDSTNPYAKGDKVTHNGKTWVSDIDNNVWEPGVYGWTEVSF